MLLTALLCLPSAVAMAQTPVGPGGVATGLSLWLDASDPDADGTPGNDPADGTTLLVWKDRSGNARDATVLAGQGGAILRTAPDAGIAGRSALTFSRSSSTAGTIYEVADLDLRASVRPDVTVLIVYRPSAASGGQGNGVWGIDNGNWDRFFIPFLNVAVAGVDRIDDGLVGLGPTQQGARIEDSGRIGVTRLLTVAYDGDVTGSVNSGPVDGSAVYFTGELVRTFTDTTHPTDAQTTFRIGWDGDDNPFVGDVAEVIIYDRVLTAAELLAVNAYLAAKYSLALGGATAVELELDSPGTVRARRPVAVTLSADVMPATAGCPLQFVLAPAVGDPRSTTTDAEGRGSITIPGVPPGVYEVTVSTAYPCEAEPDTGTLEVLGRRAVGDRDEAAPPVPLAVPSGSSGGGTLALDPVAVGSAIVVALAPMVGMAAFGANRRRRATPARD
jgi:hypothetical protein